MVLSQVLFEVESTWDLRIPSPEEDRRPLGPWVWWNVCQCVCLGDLKTCLVTIYCSSCAIYIAVASEQNGISLASVPYIPSSFPEITSPWHQLSWAAQSHRRPSGEHWYSFRSQSSLIGWSAKTGTHWKGATKANIITSYILWFICVSLLIFLKK